MTKLNRRLMTKDSTEKKESTRLYAENDFKEELYSSNKWSYRYEVI